MRMPGGGVQKTLWSKKTMYKGVACSAWYTNWRAKLLTTFGAAERTSLAGPVRTHMCGRAMREVHQEGVWAAA